MKVHEWASETKHYCPGDPESTLFAYQDRIQNFYRNLDMQELWKRVDNPYWMVNFITEDPIYTMLDDPQTLRLLACALVRRTVVIPNRLLFRDLLNPKLCAVLSMSERFARGEVSLQDLSDLLNDIPESWEARDNNITSAVKATGMYEAKWALLISEGHINTAVPYYIRRNLTSGWFHALRESVKSQANIIREFVPVIKANRN